MLKKRPKRRSGLVKRDLGQRRRRRTRERFAEIEERLELLSESIEETIASTAQQVLTACAKEFEARHAAMERGVGAMMTIKALAKAKAIDLTVIDMVEGWLAHQQGYTTLELNGYRIYPPVYPPAVSP